MSQTTLKVRLDRIELGLSLPESRRLVIHPEDYSGDMDEARRQARIQGAIAVVPRKCESDEEWLAEITKEARQ